MARPNYTRLILAAIAQGHTAYNSVGPEHEVQYQPRSKNDSRPWCNGVFRYSGREVHTVPPTCAEVLLWMGDQTDRTCVRPKGHNGMCHD